jgi:four helix bundle protein
MDPLIRQVVRSGTSVGANYCEADEAPSRKDFRYKMSLCKKELKETKHWLRMIVAADPAARAEAARLWEEAGELLRIFAAI